MSENYKNIINIAKSFDVAKEESDVRSSQWGHKFSEVKGYIDNISNSLNHATTFFRGKVKVLVEGVSIGQQSITLTCEDTNIFDGIETGFYIKFKPSPNFKILVEYSLPKHHNTETVIKFISYVYEPSELDETLVTGIIYEAFQEIKASSFLFSY